MRKLLLGFSLVLVAALALYLHFHHRVASIDTAYAANRQVDVWSTAAPIRELVTTANYGDKLDVLSRSGESVQVRTASGATGWVNENDLITGDSWQQAQALLSATREKPPVARGQTRVLSNLRLGPSRTAARIWQLNRGIPVDLFERNATTVSQPSAATQPPAQPAQKEADDAAAEDTQSPDVKKEDWWLVRAQVPEHGDVVGWILGRFVDLDVPAPLPDYANSAGMRIVAWFELNDVPDGLGAAKPQYLVVGARGGEGQPCDFTTMRAYTWSKKEQQYETAFAESGLCGELPVQLKRELGSGADLNFSFADSSDGPSQTLTYQMRDTVIRRVRPGGERAKPAKRKRSH